MININYCSPEYRAYLESSKWQAIRQKILNRDGYSCRLCGSKSKLNVHHIRGNHRFNEADHLEDLCVLCEDCHTTIHMYYRLCDSLKKYYDKMRE